MQETRTTWVLANRSTVSIADYNARHRQKTHTQKSLQHKKDQLRHGYHGMIFFTNSNATFICFPRYTYQLILLQQLDERRISVHYKCKDLPGWLSHISLRLSYQLQLKKLSRCAFSRWTWFHAGDFRPELPNIVIDYDVPVVSRKVAYLRIDWHAAKQQDQVRKHH